MARLLQRRYVPTYALLAMALALAILVFHDVLFPPAATLAALRTATVATGTVTTSVTATGSLVPAQQMSLGFKTGGTLTAVNVHVGDTVTAGQVLATLDPQPLQLALQQAQAQLASAQAALANTQGGTALQQAADQLSQAQQAYGDAVNQANQAASADQSQLGADQATLNADTATLSGDQSAYAYQQYLSHLQSYQASLASAESQYQADQCLGPTPSPNCSTDQNSIKTWQNDISCIQAGSPIPGGAACTFDQQQMQSAYHAEATVQGQVSADSSRVSADSSKLSADQASGTRSIQQAQNGVTNAQDAYNSQSLNRPATLAQQAAQVAVAQAQVGTAQSNLDGATLTAPIAGVIAAVSAEAGDAVGAGGSSTGSQAPGTTALLPSSGSGSSGTGSGSSGGFITLTATGSYVTVVSMAESDAAKVAPGQTGTATFDAVSGLSVPVHVLAVGTSATVTSNVVNYYVTLTLDSADKRLKSGMTTNATIVTAQAPNVLTVLNAAIIHRGTQAFVNVLQAGREVLTPVNLGLTGGSSSEVVDGLTLGQKVVLPTAATTTTRTSTLGGGGRFGGGGGAGLGLGG